MSKEVLVKKIEISNVIKEELKNQVSEVVATNNQSNKVLNRNFTVYEMWNRQRKSRSASEMLRRWYLN